MSFPYCFKTCSNSQFKRTGLTIYILNLAETVATHTNNLLATVSVITPMTSDQKSRLEQILNRALWKTSSYQ